MGAVLAKLRDLLFTKKIEICVVGLENSGKSTFCNYLALGANDIQEPPTIGLNVKIMKRGGVTCKVWDIGGQQKYRPEWSRYARGCNVIAFVCDTQCPNLLPVCKKELHQLLEDRELSNLPLLILANKIDLGPKISEKELIEGLNLDYIVDNPWLILPISAREGTNIDQALKFLISHAN